MTVQIQRRLFSVIDFYKMLDVGIFTEDDRVELLDGEIITMSPIDAKHAAIVDRLANVLVQYLVRSCHCSFTKPCSIERLQRTSSRYCNLEMG